MPRPFAPGEGYSKFAAYALLEHGGGLRRGGPGLRPGGRRRSPGAAGLARRGRAPAPPLRGAVRGALMAGMTPLDPVVVVQVARTRFALEAVEAGRPQAGLTASVRVIEGTTVRKSSTLVLADEDARRAYARSALCASDPTAPGAPQASELEAALLDLQTAVEVALRGPAGGRARAGDAGAPDAPGTPSGPQTPYRVEAGGATVWSRPIAGGTQRVPLANFSATIVGERVIDDGANEPRTEFEIAGRLAGPPGQAGPGPRLRTLTVPAARFQGMAWVAEGWGSQAIVYAGATLKDHLRVAIQATSAPARRTTFAHFGWRRLDGADGGLGLPARRGRRRRRTAPCRRGAWTWPSGATSGACACPTRRPRTPPSWRRPCG